MSCPVDPCLTPVCKGAAWRAAWRAASKEKSDFAAFLDDVHAYMRAAGRSDFGRCVKHVFDRAQAGECLFG